MTKVNLRNNHRYAVVVQDLAAEWIQFYPCCEDLPRNHRTSTPHRSETNGIAERAVRRTKEGTFAVLLQSGLDEKWWPDSVGCYRYLRNGQDLLADGKTPFERRFGETVKGPMILFGAMFEYHPISAKDQSKLHHFDKKVLLEYSSDMHCSREEFGKEILWLQTLRNWKTWTRQRSILDESMQKKC